MVSTCDGSIVDAYYLDKLLIHHTHFLIIKFLRFALRSVVMISCYSSPSWWYHVFLSIDCLVNTFWINRYDQHLFRYVTGGIMRLRRCRFTSVVLFLIHRLFEIGALTAIAAVPLYIYLYVSPYRRGFFCSDTSIRFPFQRNETVSETMLLAGAVAVPVIVVCMIYYFSTNIC